MQTGFDRANRSAGKFFDFGEFIAFRVVQQDDDAVVVTELGQGLIQLPELLEALAVTHRIVRSGQVGEALARQVALVDGMHPMARKSPPFIDEQVVHDAAKPRAWFIDFNQLVDLAEGLDQQFLKQILGFGLGASQAPGKTVQAIKVWPHEPLECQVLFCATHNALECITTLRPNKDPIGVFRHLTAMNKKYVPAILGVSVAIVITTTMDATGYSVFSALPLFPLAALFWYLEKLSREEIGLVWGRLHGYMLALVYPVMVLGGIGLIALFAGAVDTSTADWAKVALNVSLMSTTGIVMVLITEEGFFRGWLWATLKRAGQTDIAVLLWTTLAFTAWHISAISLDTGFDVPAREIPVYLVNATLLGAIWGMLRMISGSIVVPSVCHSVWNGIDYPLYGFGEKVGALGIEQTHIYGPEVGVVGIILNLAVAAGFFYLLINRNRKRAS